MRFPSAGKTSNRIPRRRRGIPKKFFTIIIKDIMKRFLKLISIALAAVMLLGGCRKIENEHTSESSKANSSATSETSRVDDETRDGFRPEEYSITRRVFTARLEAEKAATDGVKRDMSGNLLNGDNDGYVSLGKDQHVTQVATVTASQFYRVVLKARSKTGASITLHVGDTEEGSYYIPPNTETTENSETGEFGLYAVDNLYIAVGMNALRFTVGSGTADIDCIIIEDTDRVGSSAYAVGGVCVTPKASAKTLELLQSLTFKYGDKVFAAQNVSCGSNAELEAVYIETKRFPAIRVSELALALKDDPYSSSVMIDELSHAKTWNADGGILSYAWHWYSPNETRGTLRENFDLPSALERVDPSELALLDKDAMQLQADNALLPQGAMALAEDIDLLAVTLKEFADADIPIIFEPIPDGDTGLYWWGGDAESYKTLWILTFDRLTKYHGLNNLIWVWNNSNFDYYPGDSYVDIIGQSFYELTTSSFAGRFGAIAEDNRTGRKPIAITACATLPSIDNMFRDNAMWLWVAPDSGGYTIDSTGKLSEAYTKKSAFRVFYNNDKVITLDEL